MPRESEVLLKLQQTLEDDYATAKEVLNAGLLSYQWHGDSNRLCVLRDVLFDKYGGLALKALSEFPNDTHWTSSIRIEFCKDFADLFADLINMYITSEHDLIAAVRPWLQCPDHHVAVAILKELPTGCFDWGRVCSW